MYLLNFCTWLQHTAVGSTVRSSTWLFPAIETCHILGLALIIGSIMWLDFRLLGFSTDSSVNQVARKIMPTAWLGMMISLTTGFLLFASEAVTLYRNIAFQLKIAMLLLLAVNAVVYQLVTAKNMGDWDKNAHTPLGARLAALVSIVLWMGVVAAGRWIAYAGTG
jgi:hypothetical protein